MGRRSDTASRVRALKDHLAGRENASAKELCAALHVSQSMLSRLVGTLGHDILVGGKARATRYALRRDVPGVGQTVPVYEVLVQGQTRPLAILHMLSVGVYVETHGSQAGFYPGLPYFLHDMRPSGFLGRLLPARHPELEAPDDILLWSDDDCLRYLTRFGWDLGGNLVIGERAFAGYLDAVHRPRAAIQARQRLKTYREHAEDVLQMGAPGSSAAGEQPKFLATLAPNSKQVLVKFSPPTRDAVGRRMADLLWCEHLMLDLLRRHSIEATHSEILQDDVRIYLQVDRFDRAPGGGRRGVLSLTALDLEFVGGHPHGWVETTEALAKQGHVPGDVVERVRLLALIGRLIGNNDMHGGNLAFLTRGLTPYALAPIYDMLPMMYAPHQGHLPVRKFAPALPKTLEAAIWATACTLAQEFWQRVKTHSAISADFRKIAQENEEEVARLSQLARHLPA